jgi:NAD(P)-dependent dehydrogenase (short-subunit alcohol dehydrogenase family)
MNQRVLITAATSGIGLEMARAFSAAGAAFQFRRPFQNLLTNRAL